ncbi:hypothetical protein [Phaffia rhodozyma]|uniref:Extracellular membrane protein, CFEM domain n=1 Tax=Phaffia rhodozyma TaxID=264483 RepID=A0A0F7SFQ2_PHARH|nr:hypothetical protein [Phaffia rhodozyma]
MISSTSVFVAFTLALSLTAKAQSISIPAGTTLPAACTSDCSQTLSVVQTCGTLYAATNQTIACVCNGLPSDLSSCATCLNSNGETAIATQLAALGTACPTELADCTFECGFTVCDATDQACTCTTSYLQDVLNCAGCSAANGVNGTVSLAQYETLAQSCLAAGLTSVPTTTEDLPSPSGSATQQASSAAAASTAVSSAVAAVTSAAAVGSTSAAVAAGSTSASAAASSGASAAASISKAASSVAASASAAIPSATSGANRLTTGAAAVPALLLLSAVLL